jgi:hypothetical protein
MTATPRPSLESEIGAVLNRHSVENDSDTPDFILARFVLNALTAYSTATRQRVEWYGQNIGARPARALSTATGDT